MDERGAVSPSEGRGRSRYESSASLRLAKGPLVGPVLCRVVSIVLARANCPMDRMDDAMLICDALSAHVPGAHREWPARLRRERAREGVRAACRGARRAGREQARAGCGAARSGQRVGAHDRRAADRTRRERRRRGAGVWGSCSRSELLAACRCGGEGRGCWGLRGGCVVLAFRGPWRVCRRCAVDVETSVPRAAGTHLFDAGLQRAHQVGGLERLIGARAVRARPARRRPCDRSGRAAPRGRCRGSWRGRRAGRSSRPAGGRSSSSLLAELAPCPRASSGSSEVGSTSSPKFIVVITQHLIAGMDRDELLTGAQHDTPDRDLVGVVHRLEQQPVGTGATAPGTR